VFSLRFLGGDVMVVRSLRAGIGPDGARRRGRGDRGAGLVAGLVLIVAMTTGALLWLTINVDTDLVAMATADDLAFQIARAAASEIDIAGLRADPRVVRIDPVAATARAEATASRLFSALGVNGEVIAVVVDGDRATVQLHLDGVDGVIESGVSARAVSG
jgi:hypothetical protein